MFPTGDERFRMANIPCGEPKYGAGFLVSLSTDGTSVTLRGKLFGCVTCAYVRGLLSMKLDTKGPSTWGLHGIYDKFGMAVSF